MATSSRKKPSASRAGVPARKQAGTKAGKARSAGPRKAKKPAESGRSAPAMAEVDAEVLEFIAAIDRFKQEHSRPFPSWSEILLVLRELGYRRT